jgi:hypothetical protein
MSPPNYPGKVFDQVNRRWIDKPQTGRNGEDKKGAAKAPPIMDASVKQRIKNPVRDMTGADWVAREDGRYIA